MPDALGAGEDVTGDPRKIALIAGVAHNLTPASGASGPGLLSPDVTAALSGWLHDVFGQAK